MIEDVTYSESFDTAPLERITNRLHRLQERAVVVGWPGDGSPMHQERLASGAVASSAHTTVAAIAVIHEFGSVKNNIPARPILRTAAEKYGKSLQTVTTNLYKGILRGDINEHDALAKLGLFWEGKVRKVFTDSPGWAPLSPSTLRSKTTKGGLTGTQPLLDTGHLRRSITSRVVGSSYR